MYLVNRLLKLNTKGQDTGALQELSGGQLFIVRTDPLKNGRECIFDGATLSLRKTPHAHNYELVVTLSGAEDDEFGLDLDHTKTFLADAALDPLQGFENGQCLIQWNDVAGDDPDDRFEFLCSASQDPAAVDTFIDVLLQHIWERRFNADWPSKPADRNVAIDQLKTILDDVRASKADMQALEEGLSKATLDEGAPEGADDVGAAEAASDAASDAASAISALDGDEAAHEFLLTVASQLPPIRDQPEELSLIQEAQVQLSLYMYELSGFVGLESAEIALLLSSGKDNYIRVTGPSRLWAFQVFTSSNDMNFDDERLSFVFVSDNYENIPTPITFECIFGDYATFNAYREYITKTMFEKSWGANEWTKLSEEDREYHARTLFHADRMDVDLSDSDDVFTDAAGGDSEEEESETESESESESEASAASESDSSLDAPPRPGPIISKKTQRARKPRGSGPKSSKISKLAIGYKDGLSFVVQGDRVGVFQNNNRKLKFMTSIENVTTPDGKAFTPGNVMLHKQDTEIVLSNPLEPGVLYRLDLTRGAVTDRISLGDVALTNYMPDFKYAQTTAQDTFVGMSSNSVFRIDPRIKQALVDTEMKSYATKTAFSTGATTQAGFFALGSDTGFLRLYDKLGKNAKTLLPSMGEAITGVDVTADGKYVLATFRDHLLLVDCTLPEGTRYAGQTGFERSFPKDQKPDPVRLALRPQHAALVKSVTGSINFTPAKFNQSLDKAETTIVTSTGPFVIAWSLAHLRKGALYNYVMTRYEDGVVADNFKFGEDRDIIVALPEDLVMQHKNKLKSATTVLEKGIVKQY